MAFSRARASTPGASVVTPASDYPCAKRSAYLLGERLLWYCHMATELMIWSVIVSTWETTRLSRAGFAKEAWVV